MLLRLRLLLAILSVPSLTLADAPAERLPIPSATKQVEAEQRIKSVFKTEYADRTPRGRASLARRLIKEAAATSNDADTPYVLLREARDRAAEAGNIAVALDAIDAMDQSYIIDALAMKADTVAKAGPSANTQGRHLEVISSCMEIMEDAIAQDRYDTAMKITSLADAAATQSKSMVLVGVIDARVKEIRLLNAEYNRAKSAMTRLKTDQD